MKHTNFRDIEIPLEYKKLIKDGYIIEINKVEDRPEKESLLIYYDIAEGYYTDFFLNKYKKNNYWSGTFFVSYQDKDSCKRFFKMFIQAIESSNEGYVFNYDEQTLVGKKLGVILMLQLTKKNNKKYWNYVPSNDLYNSFKSVQAIRNGEFKVPESNKEYGITSYMPDYSKNGFMEKG